MTTIDNIMALADSYAAVSAVSTTAHAVEVRKALRTALTELASTATKYQQAADKMVMEHKVERDTLRQQLAEAQKRITSLEAIEKQLSDNVIWQAGEIAKHLDTIEARRNQEPLAFLEMKYEGVHEYLAETFAGATGSIPVYAAPVVAPDDTKRLDWLDKNIFNRENLDWITKKVSHTENMWVMFAPVGVQGSARAIIDAAMGGAND